MNALPTDQPSKYINPFTDFGFKRIFGQEDSKLVLLGFLNGIFKGDPVIESIEDVIYLDKEQLGEAFDEVSVFRKGELRSLRKPGGKISDNSTFASFKLRNRK